MKPLILIVILGSFLSAQDSYIDSTKIKNPRLAWKLGFIPGLGQLYNGKYLKSIGYIGAEYYALTRFLQLKREGRIGLRNTYAWWIFGLYVWGILDAYVDAHFSTFPVKEIPERNDNFLNEKSNN